MNIYTVDIESHYSKEYSLSRKDVTTQSYVDDERFEVIGVAVKKNDEPTVWFSGAAVETEEFLAQFDFENSFLLAHNALFDATILSWRFGIHPKVILDTLSMARAKHGVDAGGSLKALAERYGLGVKGEEVILAMGKRRVDFTPSELRAYGEYCKNDVELTYALFKQLASSFIKSEIALIDMTIKMHTKPQFQLDSRLLHEHLEDVRGRKTILLIESGIAKEDLMSNQKLAEVLESFGVEPPMKVSPRTGKLTYAFAKSDAAFKALLEHDNFSVQAVVAARLGVKSTLEETRTERFIRISEQSGSLPVPLKYYAAVTGRWGGCLVADTQVIVYDRVLGVVEKAITDVLLDDLVWDGEAFVQHEGVVFNGYAEVITWDGVTGTEDHIVFTEAGEISLHSAMQGQHKIAVAGSVSKNAVDSARGFISRIKS